jgi:hypothetical protein
MPPTEKAQWLTQFSEVREWRSHSVAQHSCRCAHVMCPYLRRCAHVPCSCPRSCRSPRPSRPRRRPPSWARSPASRSCAPAIRMAALPHPPFQPTAGLSTRPFEPRPCHARHSNWALPLEWRALPQQRCAAADPPRWHRGWQASDAFFPFRDSLDTASTRGVSYVVAAGGSVADAEVLTTTDRTSPPLAPPLPWLTSRGRRSWPRRSSPPLTSTRWSWPSRGCASSTTDRTASP